MISFLALILSMSVPDSIGSFRFNPVIRDTACQSSCTADVKENTSIGNIGNNIISYGSFSDKNR